MNTFLFLLLSLFVEPNMDPLYLQKKLREGNAVQGISSIANVLNCCPCPLFFSLSLSPSLYLWCNLISLDPGLNSGSRSGFGPGPGPDSLSFSLSLFLSLSLSLSLYISLCYVIIVRINENKNTHIYMQTEREG